MTEAIEFERYRPALTGYCYRLLGSPFEAEDAVQETLLRAWRGLDRFEGRAQLKSWLYRIASNVCFDMLEAGRRRAVPLEIGAPGSADSPLAKLEADDWVEPIPDRLAVPEEADPSEVVAGRETLRLAFVVALQRLPARQRAVLVLREVLRFPATEVAEMLDTSVASVTSALARARATLGSDVADPTAIDGTAGLDEEDRALLDRYVSAFEAFDVDGLVALLHQDATMSMPPFTLWLRGADELRRWWLSPRGSGCRGSRLVPVRVNGRPGFAQYRVGSDGATYTPWGIQIVDHAQGQITGFLTFLDTPRLFPLFRLPSQLEPVAAR